MRAPARAAPQTVALALRLAPECHPGRARDCLQSRLARLGSRDPAKGTDRAFGWILASRHCVSRARMTFREKPRASSPSSRHPGQGPRASEDREPGSIHRPARTVVVGHGRGGAPALHSTACTKLFHAFGTSLSRARTRGLCRTTLVTPALRLAPECHPVREPWQPGSSHTLGPCLPLDPRVSTRCVSRKDDVQREAASVVALQNVTPAPEPGSIHQPARNADMVPGSRPPLTRRPRPG